MRPKPLGTILGWTLAAILLEANVAAYVLDLYSRWWWFDRVLHLATILALTLWLALFVVARALSPDRGRSLLAVVIFSSVGLAAGAIWEVMEWGADLALSGNIIKGKYDTVLDIAMDTIGALLAGLLAIPLLRPRA
jgi:VanZ family protein